MVASPWQVVRTLRAQCELQLLQVLERLYSVVPPTAPDCWISHDGRSFNMEPIADSTPLTPCASIVMYQQKEWNARLPGILHHQMYIGRGLCVSVNSNDTVSVCGLMEANPQLVHRVWTSDAAGLQTNWRPVLQRCMATLGRLPWQPKGSNCHTVTRWQLTGIAPQHTAISYAWKMGSVLGILFLSIVWMCAWLAATQHKRVTAQHL